MFENVLRFFPHRKSTLFFFLSSSCINLIPYPVDIAWKEVTIDYSWIGVSGVIHKNVYGMEYVHNGIFMMIFDWKTVNFLIPCTRHSWIQKKICKIHPFFCSRFFFFFRFSAFVCQLQFAFDVCVCESSCILFADKMFVCHGRDAKMVEFCVKYHECNQYYRGDNDVECLLFFTEQLSRCANLLWILHWKFFFPLNQIFDFNTGGSWDSLCRFRFGMQIKN